MSGTTRHFVQLYLCGYLLEGYSPGGEQIWLSSVLPMITDAGYFLLHAHDYDRFVSLSKIIPDLVHMYWTDEWNIQACVYDPRCVANYQPAENGIDLSIGVPEDELGLLPLSRLFVTTWYGIMPDSWGSEWAYRTGRRGDEVWTYNPLVPQWALTPYAFPNNTFLPWSIESTCEQIPYVPHEERNETALIYAKSARIFKDARIKPEFWNSTLVQEQEFSFLSTAYREEQENIDVPAGLDSLGLQTRPAYNALLAPVKAVVGLGVPKTSPTVFSALCQGTSVVIPVWKDRPQTEEKDFWGDNYSQHAMAVTLGPPYVFPYQGSDEASLLDAVKLAMKAAPGRYIPPNMREPWVREQILKVLSTDFESLAAEVVRKNGGIVPKADEKVRLLVDENLHKIPPGKPIRWEPSVIVQG